MTESPEIEQDPQQPITISTLWNYLCGRREAILQLASSRHTVWLGLLFVISAGFAREYDQKDLLHEPWYLSIPLVASLVTSFLLFSLIYATAWWKKARGLPFLGTYRSFLGLYWMTAPLAWLYAIPVERFLTAPQATETNLWLLGIVATWRVVLMIRVVIVLFNASKFTAAMLLMLFADSVMLAGLTLFSSMGIIPSELLNVMAGNQLSESQRVVRGVYLSLYFLGFLSLPLWFVLFLCAIGFSKTTWHSAFSSQPSNRKLNRSCWIFGSVAILVWAFVLPITQPEQFLARKVSKLLSSGNIAEGFQIMEEHEKSDFPASWDPPPRFAYAERTPSTLDAMETILKKYPDAWFRDIYEEKFLNPLRSGYEKKFYLKRFSEPDMERLIDIFKQLPQSRKIVEEDEEFWIDVVTWRESLTELTRKRMREMLIELGVDSKKIEQKQKDRQNQKKKPKTESNE